ncbi:MAG: GGDEF domain-containing protein [Myxococcales bacterium]|nr:GGDEF domain-containing protein [Myxococcales bacterium]
MSLASAVLLPLSAWWEDSASTQTLLAVWMTGGVVAGLLATGLLARGASARALGTAYALLLVAVGLRNGVYTAPMPNGDGMLTLQLYAAGLFALMLAPTFPAAVIGPALLMLTPMALYPVLHGHAVQVEYAVAMNGGAVVLGLLAWSMARWQQEAQRVGLVLRHQARHDGLTGLLKRRAFFDDAEALRAEGLGLVLLDIDHFKLINDRYSHQMGDRVLVELADLIARTTPAHGRCARLGGEEFVLAVPGASLSDCQALARRLRHGATRLPTVPVTLSQGIAVAPAQQTVEAALKVADEAMYAAKRGGRNAIRLAGESSWGGVL